MSFANFLVRKADGSLEPTFNTLSLVNEPDSFDDSARITDTIIYIGNATYPVGTTSTLDICSNFQPLFLESDRVNSDSLLGVNVVDLNLPSGIATAQSGGDWFSLNNPPLNLAVPQPVRRGVFELQLDASGNGNTLFNFPSAIGRTIGIPADFFNSLEDAQKVNYIKILENKIKVNFGASSSFPGTLTYFFRILEQGEDDIEDDYLRIVSQRDSVNFQQLAILEYEVFVSTGLSSSFEYRLASYDASLNRIQAYEAFVYDPVNNPYDPPYIDTIRLNGASVQYDKDAVYLFMEVKILTGGAVKFEYKYASSKLQTALNNSIADDILPPSEALNIFNTSYTQIITDASGVDRDIAQLEADVAQLQTTTSTQQGEISNLQSGLTTKLDLSGGTMTGELNMNGSKVVNIGLPINQQDAVPLVYIEGLLIDINNGFNQKLDLSGGTMTGQINMGNQKITNLLGGSNMQDAVTMAQLNLKLNKAGDTMSGQLNMGSQKISNLQGGTLNGDAVNLAQLNQKLSLTGGTMTGLLNMGSQKITNLQTPTQAGDGANKQYVDNAVSSGSNPNPTFQSINIKDPSLTSNLKIDSLQDGSIEVSYSGENKINFASGTTTMEEEVIFSDSPNMSGNIVKAVGNPVANTDGANKQYVDNSITSAINIATEKYENAISITQFNIPPIRSFNISLPSWYDNTKHYLETKFFGYDEGDPTTAINLAYNISFYIDSESTIQQFMSIPCPKTSSSNGGFADSYVTDILLPSTDVYYDSNKTNKGFVLSLNNFSVGTTANFSGYVSIRIIAVESTANRYTFLNAEQIGTWFVVK